MRSLSFVIDGDLYAVDVTLVQKVARMLAVTPVPTAPAEVIGIANLKGKVITVLSLSKLLGSEKPCEASLYVNTIVFKPGSSHEDQMGLAVEKPGNLIDIDSSAIKSPPVTVSAEENFCISGVAEIEEKFYRIIDFEAIYRKYIYGADPGPGNTSFGGIENE